MKLGSDLDLDDIDRGILALLQENCRISLARIGAEVGLSAPSVVERVKKLEDGGVIRGYHAVLDARRLGVDITAFIGVSISHPRLLNEFESEIRDVEGVLECHHVTGAYSLMLKVKTENTSSLERLISRLRSIDGVDRTETMVVLSTHIEGSRIPVGVERVAPLDGRRGRRNGERSARSVAR
jgi:Lrp/AsnC family transcriptional regulator, leucine-responsive regulatory protein